MLVSFSQEILKARQAEAKFLAQRGAASMAEALPYEEKLQKYTNTRVAHRMRPINYKPNGSFHELKVRLLPLAPNLLVAQSFVTGALNSARASWSLGTSSRRAISRPRLSRMTRRYGATASCLSCSSS